MRITIDTKVVTRPVGHVLLKIGGWLAKDSTKSAVVPAGTSVVPHVIRMKSA